MQSFPRGAEASRFPARTSSPLRKPLLAWSIDIARQVAEIDRIIVSTDDSEIASVAPVMAQRCTIVPRNSPLMKRSSSTRSRICFPGSPQKATLPSGWFCLSRLARLRSADDVRKCLALVAQRQFDSVATFKDADLNPHRAWRLVDGIPEVFIPGAVPWLPRQKLPKAYQLNGAVYIFRAALLAEEAKSLLVGRLGAVLMPRERSQDIDDRLDFMIVEAILKESDK